MSLHTNSTKKHTQDKQEQREQKHAHISHAVFIRYGTQGKPQSTLYLTQNEILAMYWCFHIAINSDLSLYLLKDLQ